MGRDTLVAVTGSQIPCVYDLPRLLALPEGVEFRFRYRKKWVEDEIRIDPSRFKGRRLILLFHAQGSGYLIPVRSATTLSIELFGPMVYVRFALKGFPSSDVADGADSSLDKALAANTALGVRLLELTTAETIADLYRAIRAGAGDAVVIGCNTVSHLSAGVFELCRTGDDTSGEEWSRTRKMGVNTLAFRGPQQGAFYVSDPDCVPVTRKVPWSLNGQWLDLVARSGTTLFISLDQEALGPEQRGALEAALAIAAVPQPLAEPLDWQDTVCPARWRSMGRERTYDWVGPKGG